MPQSSFNPPWFVRKDLDGFFGLMIDNLIQLILIVSLCRELIRLPSRQQARSRRIPDQPRSIGCKYGKKVALEIGPNFDGRFAKEF